jgi:hypothetical protein
LLSLHRLFKLVLVGAVLVELDSSFCRLYFLILYCTKMSDISSSQESWFSRISSPTPTLREPPAEFRFGKARYMRIEHEINRKAGTPVSKVWSLGSEYINMDDPDSVHRWRCNICPKDVVVTCGKGKTASTSTAVRHLRRVHHISFANEEVEESEKNLPLNTSEDELRGLSQITALTTTLKIDRFRRSLLRWVVKRQHSLVEVEDKDFRDMLAALNEKVRPYIPGADTLRNWVDREVVESFYQVVKLLSNARSRIHISFDLWSSPNGYAFCGVVAHFVDQSWCNRQVMIALKKMTARHTGEEIAAVIVPVLREYGIAENIGIFVADNVDSNDCAISCILDKLQIDDYIENRRSRCLGHIINLVAKAFIFGQNTDAFETTVNAVNDSTPYDSEIMRESQRAWRAKGPIGKLHNIVVFVRSSPQRRAAFGRLLSGDDNVDGK